MSDKSVSIPVWVVWTIAISMMGTGLTVAGSTIWGYSKNVQQIETLTLSVTRIEGSLESMITRMDEKIERNTDRILNLNRIVREK